MGSRHLVLVGAGHAHLTTMAHLEGVVGSEGHATVISLGSYQYYSGMGPGLLSGLYPPGAVRFNVRGMAERHGARFVEGRVDLIKPDKQVLIMADGSEIGYDVVSFNVGSVVDPARAGLDSCDRLLPVKPVERLYETRCEIQRELETHDVRVAVIGGGAAGVEIAANVIAIANTAGHRTSRGTISATLITRGELLKGFAPRVRKHTRKKLEELGVRVIEGATVTSCADGKITTDAGQSVAYDRALLATGTRPPGLFMKSGLPTGPSEGLLVGKHLSTDTYPEIFGGGDCIDFAPRSLEKVGVYAVRQNPVLLDNLTATMQGNSPESFTVFEPQHTYHLILNFGDGTGLSYRKPFMLPGKLAFKLKDRIDTRFMHRFQECSEPEEIVECADL